MKKIILLLLLCLSFDTLASPTTSTSSVGNDLSILYEFKNRNYDFWHNLAKSFRWQINKNDERIDLYKNQYLKNKKLLYDQISRARPYLYLILEEIKRRNLPTELILMPMVESNFDPFAYSQANAAGLWQITPVAAKEQNISSNWWYDGRRDIIESTEAALNHMSNIHKYLGSDWLYTVAAYNSGAGNVHNAIIHNKNNNLSTDFWSLGLPQETKNYVPKLLALIDIIKNHKKYNFELPKLPDWPIITRVELDSQVDMALIADLLNLNLETIYRLNPGYNRWATAVDAPYHLLLPIDQIETLDNELGKIPADKRVRFARYVIQKGDSLSKIAKDFNTSVNVIKSLNALDSNKVIIDKQLLIPIAGQDPDLYKQNDKKELKDLDNGQIMSFFKQAMPRKRKIIRKIYYQVHKGESVGSLSHKFKVKPKDIINWNNLSKKKKLQPGDTLAIFVNITDIAKLDNV